MVAEAKYLEVRRTLADEIEFGHYAIGGKFPTELELCKRFDCSRHTVREALRALQSSGLVARRRGAGTIVCRPVAPTMFSMESSSLYELLDNADESFMEIRHSGKVKVLEPLARVIGCEVGEYWMRIAGVRRHRKENVPMAWVEVFVSEPFFGIKDCLGVNPTSVFQLLEKQFDVSIHAVEQDVNAVSIDAMSAAELGVQPDSPGLSVLRRYFDKDGALFQVAASLYGADLFTIKSRFVRNNPLDEGR